MVKRRNSIKKRSKYNIRFLLALVFIVGISAASFKMMDNAMNDEMIKIDKEISSNNKKLEEINSEIETLKNDYSIRNTDEFKEKIARQRLGMIKDQAKSEKTKPILEKNEPKILEEKTTDEEDEDIESSREQNKEEKQEESSNLNDGITDELDSNQNNENDNN